MEEMHTSARQCRAYGNPASNRRSAHQNLTAKALCVGFMALMPWLTTAWGAASGTDSGTDSAFANARISTDQETGFVRFIGAEPGYPFQLKRSPGTRAVADFGLAFARQYGAAFGLDNPDEQLAPLNTTPATSKLNAIPGSTVLINAKPRSNDGNIRHYRQLHDGVPVFAGELVVNLDENNALLSMNGEISSGLTVSVTPSVSPAAAIDSALLAVAKWYAMDPAELRASKPSLLVYDSRLLKPSIVLPSLVWQINITSREVSPIRELILVDAHNGRIKLHFNQVHMAKNRMTYDAGGSSALPGTLVCSEGDAFPDCAIADADVVNAHTYAGDAYNFYSTIHGRNGIDGLGSAITSTVHYNSWICPNAFWDGTQMVYCDGYADADDVVGHELTHGVTTSESNLLYYYEAGAINESLSDIWGEFIDLSNGTGNDSASVRWLMGEDMPGGAFRDLQFPGDYNQPDRMTSGLYYTSPGDNGGVHYNSGVGNKAAYLLTDGDTFNGVHVNGLGVSKTAKIFYEAQTHLLTSGANYADLYDVLYQACLNLVGTSGISSNDCLQVRAATDAVEMNAAPAGNASFSPDASFCPSGIAQGTILFSDDLEAGTGNWSSNDLTGAANNWSLAGGYATSGVSSLHRPDAAYTNDAVIFNTNPVVLTNDSYLHFRHSYGFEASSLAGENYDGGVIEYSMDGGASWQDLGSLFDAGQGYGGTIFTGWGNPLAGREGFVSESHGYVSSRFKLGSLAGKNFQVRFRLASDSSVSGPLGWVVDDVAIYRCGSTAAAPPPQVQSCSGVDVLVQNRDFKADTNCTASSSLATGGTAVTIKTGATIQFNSPSTTLGSGFTVELGSSFTITSSP